MTKKQKEEIANLYQMNPIEIQENMQDNINKIEEKKEETKYQKKKRKEREKRIKQKQKKEKTENEKFDFETETVIGMAQRNKRKQELEKVKKIEDKNERRRKKRIKRIKRIIKWTSIIVIIAGGTTFAMISPIFNIQDIKVLENSEVSADTIISLSGLSKGQNIFRFLSSNVEEQIKQEPYIQSAEVKRIFPNQIQITVEERKRDFSVEFLNGYAYINNQGYILEISNDKAGLPVLQGAVTPEEEIKAGNRLQKEDLEKLGTVIRIMDLCKANGLDSLITSIDMSDKNDYSIYMEQEKKTVYLGDESNLGDKILWVQPILEDNKGIEGEIYVNGDLNNDFKPRFKPKV